LWPGPHHVDPKTSKEALVSDVMATLRRIEPHAETCGATAALNPACNAMHNGWKWFMRLGCVGSRCPLATPMQPGRCRTASRLQATTSTLAYASVGGCRSTAARTLGPNKATAQEGQRPYIAASADIPCPLFIYSLTPNDESTPMNDHKMTAGEPFPDLQWPTLQGQPLAPAAAAGWRLLIVYRGKHCPLCKAYLTTLNELLPEFAAAGIEVGAVSADSQEKAQAQATECGWNFPVGYALSVHDMRRLGLYVSEPRSPQETDHDFAEPGLFVINPHGQAQIIDISNAPFARPDLKSLLKGLQFVISKDYPIRGRA
jgi:peroxiredoxin